MYSKRFTWIGCVVWVILAFRGFATGQTIANTGFNGTTAGCPTWDTSTTYLTAPFYITNVPTPSAGLYYAYSTNTFMFTVNATYVPEWHRYVLGFTSFQAGMQSTSSLSKPGTCDNNDGSFASANFSNWWGHLPNSVSLNNLPANSKTIYPANDHNGATWTSVGNGCTRQVYSANFTYGQLANCKDYYGNKSLSASQTTSGAQTLNGTFFVNLIAPANLANGESVGGYMVKTWAYNFQINDQSSIVTIGNSQSNAGVYECIVMGVGVNTNGYLQIMVTCTYTTAPYSGYNFGYFVTSTVSSNTGVNMTQASTSTTIPLSLPMTQTFTFQSINIPSNNNYTGTYSALWTLYGCTSAAASSCGVSNLVSLNVYVNAIINTAIVSNVSLTGTVTVYPNSTLLAVVQPNQFLIAGSTICVKDTVGGLDQLSLSQFTLTLNYVALCYNESATVTVPTYDGITHFGCMNSTNVAVLMNGGAVISDVVTQDYYNFQTLRNAANLYVGFCFTARIQLLDTSSRLLYPGQVSTQYVHVSMSAVLPNQKRSAPQTYNGVGGVRSYSVRSNDDDNPTTDESESSTCMGSSCDSDDQNIPTQAPIHNPLKPFSPDNSIAIGLAIGLGIGLPSSFCCIYAVIALVCKEKKKKKKKTTRHSKKTGKPQVPSDYSQYNTTHMDILPASVYNMPRSSSPVGLVSRK